MTILAPNIYCIKIAENCPEPALPKNSKIIGEMKNGEILFDPSPLIGYEKKGEDETTRIEKQFKSWLDYNKIEHNVGRLLFIKREEKKSQNPVIFGITVLQIAILLSAMLLIVTAKKVKSIAKYFMLIPLVIVATIVAYWPTKI